jgi:hypothetical protein
MYESDIDEEDFVLNYNQVDFGNYELQDIKQTGNGLFESSIFHKKEEGNTFQVCLPPIYFDSPITFDTINNKRNSFFSFELDLENSDHVDTVNWIDALDEWCVQNILKNHDLWFGDLWKEGGKLYGKPKPPPEVLTNMYETFCDGSKFTVRVPVRKGLPQIETFDISHTPIPLEKICKCQVIPIIEIKCVQVRSKKSSLDIVLRGLCAQTTCEELGIEYMNFANDDDNISVEYGTSDEEDSSDEGDCNDEEDDVNEDEGKEDECNGEEEDSSGNDLKVENVVITDQDIEDMK